MLPGEGQDVRATGRLEGIGLIGGEAVPHPEYQSLHESSRALAYPGERLPEGAAQAAPHAVDAPALVDQQDIPRLREERPTCRE